jgi:hypothetical protein
LPSDASFSLDISTWGDTFPATFPRFIFNVLDKFAVQGCSGVLGILLAQRADKEQGNMKGTALFFLTVTLGTMMFASVVVGMRDSQKS